MNKLLFVLVLTFGIAAFSLYHNFIPDDAFIHIGYAKDILSGKGYSFAGNKTYGSTAPVWPPLIAATGVVFRNLEISARFLSLIFAAASILMMFYTARLRFNSSESFIAALLLSVNAYFLRWSLSGMEASAACFFMLLMAYILYRENEGKAAPALRSRSLMRVRRFQYLLLGLSPLIRPEFYLLLFVFLLYELLKQGKEFDFVKIVLLVFPVICWLCFAKMYYGTIVPSTFLAKAGEPFFSTEPGTLLRNTKLFLSEDFLEIGFIFIAIILLITSVNNLRQIALKAVKSESLLFIIFIVSFFSFYGLKNVVIISRYSLMLVPIVILMTIDFVSRAAQKQHISARMKKFAWIALIATSTLYNVLFTALIVKPDADRFYHGFQKQYLKIAGTLRQLNTGNCHVAVSDVGIIGVYSGCHIDDLNGLVDKDRFRFKSREEYLNNKKPEFIIVRGEVILTKVEASLREIYATTTPPFGINGTQNVHVKVYLAHWH